ncbi:MAG TPA: TonB-dependent receptor [Rhodothermales bacterium]|nr:TonB-dependent receptor [Rhodothermales bacterium]
MSPVLLQCLLLGWLCAASDAGLSLPHAINQQRENSATEESSAQTAVVDHAEREKSDPILLEEITVTANRRENTLQKTPMSVSVIKGEDLYDRGADQAKDYAGLIPGLSLSDPSGFNKLTLRGISSSGLMEHHALTGLYLDDSPISHPGAGGGFEGHPDPYLLDLDRIEVVRGPQGTLYGAGAMGGVVKIITREPVFDRTEGRVDISLGVIERGETTQVIETIVNVPLVPDRAALRVVAFANDQGGYIDNIDRGPDVNDRLRQGARISLNWHPGDKRRFSASITGQQDRSEDIPQDDHGLPDFTQAGSIPHERADDWLLASLTSEYQWRQKDIVFTTSFLNRSTDVQGNLTKLVFALFGAPLPTTILNRLDTRELTHELRISGEGGERLGWLAGVFYQDRDARFTQNVDSPGLDELTGGLTEFFGAKDKLFVTEYDGREKQLDWFGELSYRLSPRWTLTAGNRWYRIDQRVDRFQSGVLFEGPTGLNGNRHDSDVTPKIGLAFYPDAQTTYYATIAHGYRPGGSNLNVEGAFCQGRFAEIGLDPPFTFGPDSLRSYEAGWRQQWPGRQLYVAAGGYHIERTDIPVGVFPECGVIINAGEAVSDGAELEISYLPIRGLVLTAAAGYVDSRISEDAPLAVLVKGDPIPMVPKWAATASGSYWFSLTKRWTGNVRLDYRFVDERPGAIGLDSFGRPAPAYQLTDMSATMMGRHWQYKLSIDNLFDERAVYFRHGGFLRSADIVNQPRTLALRISRLF